jgi:hypothetical protein
MLLGIQGKIMLEHPFSQARMIFDFRTFLTRKVIASIPVIIQADLAGPVYGRNTKAAELIKLLYSTGKVSVTL